MGYLRNLLSFAVFALIITGCGGGNTTIAADSATGTSSGGVSSGSGTSGSTGTVTLQWTAPTTLADGTTPAPLSSISGYTLFYGPSATNTPNAVNISDGGATQYTITLPPGSYYFVICAVDTNGNQGLKSVALLKSI